MAKIQNVYRDEKSKKWFYKKRLPKGNPLGKEWLIKKGFDTASQAKLELDRHLKELEKFEINPDGNIKLEDFAKTIVFPSWGRELKRRTLELKKGRCKIIFNYFKGKSFNEIEQKDIAGFKSYLVGLEKKQGEPLTSMYINLILCSLSQIYDLACEHEIVKENIARKIKGLPQKTKTEVDYWTFEEFERFLSVIDDTSYIGYLHKLGYYMMFFTGLRIGELMARKWSDINWDSQSIYIDSTLDFRGPNSWSASVKDGPKTSSSKGWVKLSPKVIEMLKEWQSKQVGIGKMEYICMYDGEMYNPHNWTIWKNKYLNKWNNQSKEEYHLKNIRVHDLRDSHGMWLLMQGVDLKTIQKRLRHAKATTTMNYYLDKLPDSEDKVLENY